MSMRVAALNVTQSDDFDIVLNLISQLSNVLEDNRAVTNELISVADTLDTDDDDETDSESVSESTVTAVYPESLPLITNFFFMTLGNKLCSCKPSSC